MRSWWTLLATCLAVGCAPEPEYVAPGTGGANLNDRTNTVDGERMPVGSMSVSPEGRFVVLHDATTTLVDLQSQTQHVRRERWERVVFGADVQGRPTAYVSRPGYDGLVAIDLESGADKWSLLPAYYNEAGAQFFRIAQEGKLLLVGDVRRVFRIDTKNGEILGTSSTGDFPQFATLSPTGKRLIVVGETTWKSDAEPRTPVTSVDLESGASFTTEIPNCAAPPAIVPDDSRVLLAPTFCARGASFELEVRAQASVTVDPVSMIDLAASGEPRFVRNLPGFGPVTLSKDGTLAVAFLDTTRIDASLFDDPKQVPGPLADRYHLMMIDPRTATFDLQAIGESLPRFAFSENGKRLLIDSTVVAQRRLTLFDFERSSGSTRVSFFKETPASSLLGILDLESRTFRAVEGPRTSLDRFVQLPDQRTVYTITRTAEQDGRLGVLDIEAGTVRDAGAVGRDLSLLPNGRVLLRRGTEPVCVTHDLVHCEGR